MARGAAGRDRARLAGAALAPAAGADRPGLPDVVRLQPVLRHRRHRGLLHPALRAVGAVDCLGVGAIGGALAARCISADERPTTDDRSTSARTLPLVTRHLVSLFPCLLAFLLPLYLLLTNFAPADQSRNTAARAFWEATLAQPIPQNAILVTNDRDEMMPLWYMQYVEGRRPDLTGLFPLIQPTPDWADVGATTDSALRSGRPVLLIKEMPGLEVKFQLTPEGKLVSVLGPAASGQPSSTRRGAFRETGDVIRLTRLRHPAGDAGARRDGDGVAALAAVAPARLRLHHLRPPGERRRPRHRRQRPSARRRLLPDQPVEAGRDAVRHAHAHPGPRSRPAALCARSGPVHRRERAAPPGPAAAGGDDRKYAPARRHPRPTWRTGSTRTSAGRSRYAATRPLCRPTGWR